MSIVTRARLPAGLGMLVLLCASGAALADAPGHNVADWVQAASSVGSANEEQRVAVVLFLGFQHLEELQTLIAAQSDPHDANYGKYLTPEEFHRRFSPDIKDTTRVGNWLRHAGFADVRSPASGLFVEASGTVAQLKSTFAVTQNVYSHAGKILRANAQTPRLPSEIASLVTYIAGLDDTALLRRHSHIRLDELDRPAKPSGATSAAAPEAAPPGQSLLSSTFCSRYYGDHKVKLTPAVAPFAAVLPWWICGYTPQQLRQAYGASLVAQTGKGVRVGIVDTYASPTIERDTNRFAQAHELPLLTNSNFRQIVPAGLKDVPADDPCGPQGWYEEETVDVESLHAMAPGASIVYVGQACSTDPMNAGLYDLIDNHRVDIVSNSYGYGGETLPDGFIDSENQYFMQAAAEGMSILFASGDGGDQAAINGIGSGSFEATSPYVTAVGGTSLALSDDSGAKQEWGWGTYRATLGSVAVSADGKTMKLKDAPSAFEYYAGSGGGPSLKLPAPGYQSAVPYDLAGYTVQANGTRVALDKAYRVTPDVSMVGDPYTGVLFGETYTISHDPNVDAGCTTLTATTEYCEVSIGGTSVSTPLFAGVLALVDEARLTAKKPTVGLINPALYSLPAGAPNSTSAAIIDVRAPASPTALVRGYAGYPTEAKFVTVNSAPHSAETLTEGADTSLRSAPGYDNVTGVGVPNVPGLIKALVP